MPPLPYRRVLATLALVAAGCQPALVELGEEAQLSCRAPADCPEDFVCLAEAGRCRPRSSPCITAAGESFAALPAGTPCTRADATAGICLQGACTQSRCGDGIRTLGEACDDGNTTDGDGCDEGCRTTGCGNAVLTPGEVCDDGNVRSGDGCSADCLSTEACGNGIVDLLAGEWCDDGPANADLADAPCRGDCTPGRCGDGIVDPARGEACDGANLAGQSCASLGYHPSAAPLTCLAHCQLDLTVCPGRCGDGVRDAPLELCDGRDFGVRSCEDYGYYGGALTCADGCARIDTQGCAGYCGDGVANGGEECDGLDQRGLACTSFGADGGALTCSWDCHRSRSDCFTGGGWTTSPSGITSDLFSVWAFAKDDVWASGRVGGLLHWDGSRWTPSTSGPRDLFALWGASPGQLWAVGDQGMITFYDGTTWTPQVSGTTWGLMGVWGLSATEVYAVGSGGQILRYNGSSWTPMSSGTVYTLNEIWGTSSSNLFAVGDMGTIRHFDGTSWTAMTSGTTTLLTSVWGQGPQDVWAGGWNGVLLHYDGTGWSPVTSGTASPLQAARGVDGDALLVGNNGTILRCKVGGCSEIPTGLARTLYDVGGTSGSDLWAVGAGGTILHNGGEGWKKLNLGVGYTVTGMWGSSADDVFMPCSGGGSTLRWNGSSLGSIPVSAREDVWGASPTQVFFVGSTSLTFWNGTSTTYLAGPGAGKTLHGIWGTGANDAVVVGSGGTVGQCTPTGCTFSSAGTTTLRDVWGDAVNGLWAVGDAGALVHRDGAAWTVLPRPTTQNLRAIWSSGAGPMFAVGVAGAALMGDGTWWQALSTGTNVDLYDVWGTSSRDVYAVGAGGLLLHYDGTSWSAMSTGVPDALNAIWGVAGEAVFAAGERSTVLRMRAQLPRQRAGACGEVVRAYCGLTLHGSTRDADFRLGTSGCTGTGLSAGEVVYRLDGPTDGAITARLTPRSGGPSLAVLGGTDASCDPATCLGSAPNAGQQVQTVTFTATAGNSYYLVVGGANPGDFSLTLDCARP